MSECPIGLICEHFENNCRYYCAELAKPWPLPLEKQFDFKLFKEFGFKVVVPTYEEYSSNQEWEIEVTNRYNEWAGQVREELWLAGYYNAIDLPYQYHPDGGIEVIYHLPLDSDVTFSSPWTSKGHAYSPSHLEEFMPPIPINSWPHEWAGDIEADGFYNDWLIYWTSDFEDSSRNYDYEE